MVSGHDAIVAVDVGGTNIRTGIVELGKKPDLSEASVRDMELWRHGDEKEVGRDDAIDELAKMLKARIKAAKPSGIFFTARAHMIGR